MYQKIPHILYLSATPQNTPVEFEPRLGPGPGDKEDVTLSNRKGFESTPRDLHNTMNLFEFDLDSIPIWI